MTGLLIKPANVTRLKATTANDPIIFTLTLTDDSALAN